MARKTHFSPSRGACVVPRSDPKKGGLQITNRSPTVNLPLSPAPDHNHPCQCRASAAAPSGRPRDGALGTLGRPCARCVCEIGIFLAQPRAQSILFEFNYLWVVPERCPCLWPRRLTVTHPSCINHPSIHAPARPPTKQAERTNRGRSSALTPHHSRLSLSLFLR